MDKCIKCGGEFTCDIEAGKDKCWCFDKPHVMKPDPTLKGCYCPKCLDEKIIEAQSQGV